MTPSFMQPPSDRCRSSQWSTTGTSKARAYSMARPHDRTVHDRFPSSEIATQPARRRSPISASSLAFGPLRDRPDRIEMALPAALPFQHELGDGLIVVHGVRVRHRADRRETAGHGCFRT